MKYNSRRKKELIMNKKSCTLLGFIGGVLVGAGLGLMFAPKSGKELRHDISKKTKKVYKKIKRDMDDAREYVVEKSLEIETTLKDLSKEKVVKEAKKKAKKIQNEYNKLLNYVVNIKDDTMQEIVYALEEKVNSITSKVLDK